MMNLNDQIEKDLSVGLHQIEITFDGQPLRYTLQLPSLSPHKNVPLILALHYGGEVTPFYSQPFLEQLILPGLESLNAIIIAPDCPASYWSDAQSEAALLYLLEKMQSDFPVDKSRVLVTGYSRGGMGTWFMATKHAKLFSAAIPISAKPTDEPDGSVPFYVIHSREDELFPLSLTEEAVHRLRERGGQVELQIEDNITHFETEKFAYPLTKALPWIRKIWHL